MCNPALLCNLFIYFNLLVQLCYYIDKAFVRLTSKQPLNVVNRPTVC